MKEKIVLSHPTGNANVRGAANGFLKRDVLHSFHTSVATFSGNIFDTLSKMPPFREFQRREFNLGLKDITHCYPFRELGRIVCSKLKLRVLTTHETGRFCIDKVYESMDQNVAHFVKSRAKEISAVYCYEDCAEQIFTAAKRANIACIYDLPIGYWRAMRRLLECEKVSHPEWAVTLGGFNDSEEKLSRKDRELALAEKIYVASSFTKRTLEDYPYKLADIEVIPYGFPEVNNTREYTSFDGRKIRLLFVGGLSQRKGIANLFEAIEGLEDSVELTVIGGGNIDGCPALKSALSKVNYIAPIPHDEVLAQMASHDLFIFPSLFEGFGLVITEAMSQGTAVITTDRTCGPDVITHGVDGWIVEAGSTSSLRKQIKELIAKPEQITTAGKAAMATAARRPWIRYEEELAESVCNYIQKLC